MTEQLRKLALLLALVGLTGANGCAQQPKSEIRYINQQLKIIEAHKKQLIALGHITDPRHFDPTMYLATYGWHSSCGDTKGTKPIFCDGGSFGAYSFSQAAFAQAKKLYVIHGMVDAGTDILVDASYGEFFDLDNQDYPPTGKGAFDPSIVGHSVGALTYCEKYGNHYKNCEASGIRDAKVIRYIDGGHVQIDKKAKYDAEMYGLVIVPPDYVDMCDCTVGGGQ